MKTNRLGAALLLVAGAWLLGTGPSSASDFTDRLRRNLDAESPRGDGDAAGVYERLGMGSSDWDADWSGAWPSHWRADDLPIPSSGAEKSALSRDPRIDPALQAMVRAGREKGLGALGDAAKGLGVPYLDRRVLVRLVADDRRGLNRLEREVEELGGEVTAQFETVLMARVPARALADLPGLDSLAYAAPQAMFAPAYDDILDLDYLTSGDEPAALADRPGKTGTLISEGVGVIGADGLHAAGITGKGVKIGIIDFGYQLYDQLKAAGEVPEPVAARAFNASGDMASDTVHGTACAEIIHDMAPDAALYLAVIDGADDQVLSAATWLAEQDVDIISFSGGGHGGPHDGKALLDRFIDNMSETRGIAWIVAAGNDGAKHWLGRTADANGDGLIDVDNPAAPADVLLLEAPRPTQLSVLVYWDDWGPDPTLPGATLDIDAHLFALGGDEPVYLGGSTQPQNGRGRPLEGVAAEIPAGVYAVALEAKRINAAVNLHVVANGVLLHPQVPTGSIAVPATAKDAFAVGAVDVRNGEGEPFSSRGPTDDGRMKPQVVAPDHTISGAYQSQGGRFPGTSAACPHTSGLAALLKELKPGLSRADLFATLLAQVVPMGEPVPNPRYGYGYIRAGEADRPAPGRAGEGTDEPSGDFIDLLKRRLQDGSE